MPQMQFNKAVKRVSIVGLAPPAGLQAKSAASGAVGLSGLVYKKTRNKKKRKVSNPLALQERLVRRIVGAHNAVTTTYLKRHNKSTRKRRDGWISDLGLNVAKALSAAPRHLQVRRIMPNI
jgi:Family of unknown function (DUF6312)